MKKMRGLNLVGERFDKLIVMECVESGINGKLWLCLCDCGNTALRLTGGLRKKNKKFTACRQCKSNTISRSKVTHGDCKEGKRDPLYVVWKAMRGRCLYPSGSRWKYYGGKGITVCESWELYEVFKSWALSNGYKPGLSIDRIDSNKNYEPSNCQFVTVSENSKRARANVRLNKILDVK